VDARLVAPRAVLSSTELVSYALKEVIFVPRYTHTFIVEMELETYCQKVLRSNPGTYTDYPEFSFRSVFQENDPISRHESLLPNPF
jgi:hypothetical protein